MGCDIHAVVEVFDTEKNVWTLSSARLFPTPFGDLSVHPFDWRHYGVFAFLTHTVCNLSEVPPVLTNGPRGLPTDSPLSSTDANGQLEMLKSLLHVSLDEGVLTPSDRDSHSASYVTLGELLAVNYETTFEDLRLGRKGNRQGAIKGRKGEGQIKTLREFLGPVFIDNLEMLKKIGAPDRVRVVFWFDS